MVRNCSLEKSLSVVGGESITPHSKPVLNSLNIINNINVCIDYLSLNFPFDYSSDSQKLNEVEKLLKLQNFDYDEIISKSKSSNRIVREQRKYTESTSILINDSVSNDVNLTRIELKGDGCREFEMRWGEEYQNAYYNLLFWVIANGGWATRFDIAIDDFRGVISTKEIDKKIRECEYVCTARKFREDGTKNCSDYSNDGWGYLFGGEGAGTRLRMYDKNAERISKGMDVSSPYWLRYEMRFYYDIAKSMSLLLIENLGNLQVWASSLLISIMDFKTPSDSDRKTRWPTWKKWSEFLDYASKIKIVNQFQKETTIAKKREWLKRSASRVNMLCKLTESSNNYSLMLKINELVGLQKIDSSNLYAINEERSKKGMSKLTMQDVLNMRVDYANELKQLGIDIYDEEVLKRARELFGDSLEII